MYGKLIDNEILHAPSEYLDYEGNIITDFNKSISLMKQYGFKPVVDIKPNYNFDTQYCEFIGYEDNGTYIVHKYEVKEIEPTKIELENKQLQLEKEQIELALSFANIDIHELVSNFNEEQVALIPNLISSIKEVFKK